LVSGRDTEKARSIRPSKLTSNGQDAFSGFVANAWARIAEKGTVGNMFQGGGVEAGSQAPAWEPIRLLPHV
jgi:hypothetical protein